MCLEARLHLSPESEISEGRYRMEVDRATCCCSLQVGDAITAAFNDKLHGPEWPCHWHNSTPLGKPPHPSYLLPLLPYDTKIGL